MLSTTPSATTALQPRGSRTRVATCRVWNDYLDGWRGRTDLDPPSYGQVIRACNALATPADYVVCAAGGIVGELTMAWSALAENTFDCEWGFSTMGYEVSGAWGASMARRDGSSAESTGEVLAFMGDGSYLMANSDVFSTVLTGHKVIFIVCDNGGFAVINRLQVGQGGAEFNNLYTSTRRIGDTRVDLLKHLDAMGAIAETRDVDRRPPGRVRACPGCRAQLWDRDSRRRLHVARGQRMVGGRRPGGQRTCRGPCGPRHRRSREEAATDLLIEADDRC